VSFSSSCYEDLLILLRFATLLYTPEGKTITDRLWEETMEELKFADVQGRLEAMKR